MKIEISWETDDILAQRPDLTITQANQVLLRLQKEHDANYGITWETVDCKAAEMFPQRSESNDIY